MKRVLALLGLLVSVGCGSPAPTDDWVSVRRDDLHLDVEITGKLAALDSDTLGPPPIADRGDFKLAQLAPEGATVKKGDVILAFDTTELRQLLEQKQNERDAIAKEIDKSLSNARMARKDEELRLSEAEAHVRKATLKLDRPTDLTGSLELEAARLDLELAKAELAHETTKANQTVKQDAAQLEALNAKRANAEARIKETEAQIGTMKVSASRAATIIHLTNWNEQKKKVGDNVWRAEKVVEAAVLDVMIAKGEVDEVDASKAAVGQRVSLHLDALPEVTFAGTVKAIGKTVQRQSRKNPLKVVRLEIALDKTDAQRMRPGMRFRGTAETERIPNAILIPTSAIFLAEGGPIAYRRTTRGFEAVRLELGKRSRTHAQVVRGLAEGDEVSRVDLGRASTSRGAP